MEKRTLLAFAVIFAFLIGWNLIFKPKLPPPPGMGSPPTPQSGSGEPGGTGGPGGSGGPAAGGAASSGGTAGTPEGGTTGAAGGTAGVAGAGGLAGRSGGAITSAAAESLIGGRWTLSSDTESGIPIRVSTDKISAEIDPVGGDLRSWKLRDFKTGDGQPVELVGSRSLDRGSQRAHALRMLVDDVPVDLRSVAFEPSVPELQLDAGRPEGQLQLRAHTTGGGELTIGYHFNNDSYNVGVDVRNAAPGSAERRVFWEVGWPGGIASTEPDSAAESGMCKATTRVGADIYRKALRDLSRGDGSRGRGTYEGTISWAAVGSKYFTAVQLIPEALPGSVRFDGDFSRKLQTFLTRVPMARTDAATLRYTLYLGPMDYDHLAANGADVGRLIELGPAAFRPIVHGTRWLLKVIHRVIPNYGLVIILLSVAAKLAFFPLTKSSTVSMRRMQEVQPQLQRLREKYKDDQQRQSKEMFALYKKYGINPMSGCLPVVVQMPVFWALFTVLSRAIELRQAPFVAWIHDLSRPDVLFRLPVHLPIFGDKFSLLPTLMALGMWVQTKMTGMGSMPAGEGMMGMQTQMMNTMMPIMMFVIFYNSPSGLALYWLVNTVLTAWQTWHIHQSLGPRAVPQE